MRYAGYYPGGQASCLRKMPSGAALLFLGRFQCRAEAVIEFSTSQRVPAMYESDAAVRLGTPGAAEPFVKLRDGFPDRTPMNFEMRTGTFAH
jgi:hypothetical protein